MNPSVIVRKYRSEDAAALASIFYHTIHHINSAHYTQQQINVWAPLTSLETDGWLKKFSRTQPFVATINEQPVGFAEFESDGHIDCFYCHHEWIGKGVGQALMSRIYEEARQKGILRIFAEVSITAIPFFEKQGFITFLEQTVVKDGIELINYKMEKTLDSSID